MMLSLFSLFLSFVIKRKEKDENKKGKKFYAPTKKEIKFIVMNLIVLRLPLFSYFFSSLTFNSFICHIESLFNSSRCLQHTPNHKAQMKMSVELVRFRKYLYVPHFFMINGWHHVKNNIEGENDKNQRGK